MFSWGGGAEPRSHPPEEARDLERLQSRCRFSAGFNRTRESCGLLIRPRSAWHGRARARARPWQTFDRASVADVGGGSRPGGRSLAPVIYI